MWLTNLHLALPDRIIERGALYIADGRIAEIVEGDAPAAGLNLTGLMAVPGFIDLHGDMLERDIEPRPNARFPVELALYELDKRMAGAGITTAYAAVSFAWTQNDLRSQESALEIIRVIHQRRPELLIDMRIHARFEIGNPDTAPLLETLLDSGQIDLVSLMDHTPGQGQYKNVQKYVNFMTRWLGFQPEKLGDDIIGRIENAIVEQVAVPRDWGIVAEVVRLAASRGIPIASHDDDTVEKVDQMAALGVTISEFPVTLVAAQDARQRGMHVIMGAPNAYRGESNSGNLSAMAAIQAGLVDILATDYFPASLLHAAFKLVEREVMPLHEALKLVTLRPAEAMGLTDRGELSVGKRADIALIEPQAGDHPRVRATLRGGHFVFQDAMIARLASTTLDRSQRDELFA